MHSRHRKDEYSIYEPNTYVESNLHPTTGSVLLYTYNTLPSGITNVTIDSTKPISDLSSNLISTNTLNFNNGFINLGTNTLGKQFCFHTWFYPTENITPLFSIANSFDFYYDKTTNNLILKRFASGSISQIFKWSINLTLNTWNHIVIQRDYNSLFIIINQTILVDITNFYDLLSSGTTYIGKISTGNLTGNLFNIRLLNNVIVSRTYMSNNLEAFLLRFSIPSRQTALLPKRIVDLQNTEIINNSLIYPVSRTNTKYDFSINSWNISPSSYGNLFNITSGLALMPDVSIKQDNIFCLETSFSLSGNTSDVMIIGNWTSDINRFFYFYYSSIDNKVKFKFLGIDLNIQIITLGAYVNGFTNNVTLQTTDTGFLLFFNGKKIFTSTTKLYKFSNPIYISNINIDGLNNTTVNVRIRKFYITNGLKRTKSFLPIVYGQKNNNSLANRILFKYHVLENRYADKPSYTIPFTVSGTSTVIPNSTNTYTITQQKSNFNETYTISVISPIDSDTITSDATLSTPSVTIAGGSTTATFNLLLSNYAVNPYKSQITVLVTNKYISQILTITISDSRSYPLTYITSLSGFIDGYITTNSGGTIPNLLNTNNLTTTGTYINNNIYGQGYYINGSSSRLTLPAELTTVRTVILAYQELNNVTNRSYVGSDIDYTFNGGINGELVGDKVIFAGSQFSLLNSYTHRSPSVAISQNNSTMVIINDSANTVTVYNKDVNNNWTSGTTLSLDTASANLLQDATVRINSSGDCILLGIKNASNGEGVVQLWRSVSGTWTKELHLGSPVPAPTTGGFGHAVAMNDNGTAIYVSEIGNNKVYYFEKGTLWSATPVATLTDANRYGFSISCNSDCTYLFITRPDTNNTLIYTRSGNIFTLEQTLPFGINVVYNRTSGYLVLANYLQKEVRIYERTSTWNSIKTITSSANNFGYSVAIANNNNLAIGSPSENNTYLYLGSDNWTTIQTFSQPSYTNFGFSIATNNNSLLSSDYNTQVDLYSNENLFIQNIVNVRQNENTVPLTTLIDSFNPQILSFISSFNLRVKWVGDSKINTSLNGIVYGVFFFNRVLTNAELNNIEDLLLKYIRLKRFRLLNKNN